MSDNTPFFILLGILEKKGTISEEERIRLTNISSLFELLEISGKVPPVSVENNLIASCLTKCDLSSVPERINLLTKLSSIIETPELKQLVDSILEEMHSLEGLKIEELS